ncbi:MAG TPA: HAMP domain-containing sensor histidine kinase [Polyangia bacterium]|nr:HAMP domain-containing sensor histidine kinase [Polyangia bacterium]
MPTVAALGVFGVLAHEVARRALDEELGRRLATAAAGAAATVLPEQLEALGAGDEGSLTYANVLRRLEAARARLDVRRVLAVAADLGARGDTAGALALGARAYELEADSVEIARALHGTPSASPLFIGHDGVAYKRGYAAIGDGRVGLIAVEGSADYAATLAAFRRRLVVAGLVALLAVLAVTALVARRISGPVVRLADAAARLGRGDLASRIPVETRDEIGVLAATLDDTRAALQARDEHTQMMLAGIAHEVRNPLGGLELYAGLLRDALADQPERLQEVARIERELGHLRNVVSEFLEYARRPAPELASVSLAPLLEEVRELAAAGASNVAVVVEAPAALRVRADASQLRRALLNLARNAVSVMEGRAGGVTLAAHANGAARVVVEVSDHGPGVPAHLREKIFTPFFTTREKGTGLGLAFVREIVRDHGGDVTVDEAPGGGAVFRLDLPAVE